MVSLACCSECDYGHFPDICNWVDWLPDIAHLKYFSNNRFYIVSLWGWGGETNKKKTFIVNRVLEVTEATYIVAST